jgi:hypothetical protein
MQIRIGLHSKSAWIKPYHLAHKFSEIASLHPLHHPRAMILDGAVADLETQSDLLVGQASRCKLHDFPLPIGKAARSGTQFLQVGVVSRAN